VRGKPVSRYVMTGIIVLGLLTAGCDSGSGEDSSVQVSPPLLLPRHVDFGPLPQSPEKYGLPPFAVLQANPAGVLEGLFDRMLRREWAVTWDIRIEGLPGGVGEVVIDHMPVLEDMPEMLKMSGVVGTPDTSMVKFEILDDRKQLLLCGQEGDNFLVCDPTEEQKAQLGGISGFTSILDLLSLEGLERLTNELSAIVDVSEEVPGLNSGVLPGMAVRYASVGTAPSACFQYPASPTLGEVVGVDFSKGGEFCVSTDGVPVLLRIGELEIIAKTYKSVADPNRFRMSVKV